MIFTTNHGGINETVRKLSGGVPIVTWLVDRNPFKHNGYLRKPFKSGDHVITSSTANVPSLVKKFDLNESNVHYLPFMTNPSSFHYDQKKDIDISFVGSYFLNESIIYRAVVMAEGTKYYRPLLELIETLQNDFDVNETDLIREKGLGLFLLSMRVTQRHFKGAVGNMISNRKRLEYLSAVSDMGLELYGTRNLAELVGFAPNVTACFNSNYSVNTRERLVNIYDRSKIGLNINHHQATTGLGYRVFDIMCSSAMLVSNFQEQSDLDLLFGENHPIPIYKSGAELQEICRYYIDHENERVRISDQCRRLIGDKHTFKTRAADLVQIVDSDFETSEQEGTYVFYGPDDLWKEAALNTSKATKGSAHLTRALIENYGHKITNPLRRFKR